MYSRLLGTLLIIQLIFQSCSVEKKYEPIDYVDPFIGTDAHGHTFPGATTPFGMVQLSPSNEFKAWDWCSGYHYSDSIIKGFAHTHISGAGLAGLGDILVMPTSGTLRLSPGTEAYPDSGYRSRFSHEREEASPGYYSVMLDDYNIKVELTASPRVGFHRYTFYNQGEVNIIVDPSHHIMERLFGTEVEIISDTEIRGYKNSEGEGGNRHVYFYAQFSKPFSRSGVAKNNVLVKDTKNTSGINTNCFAGFKVQDGDVIELKVAISHVSYEGAKKNFNAEAVHLDFNMAHIQARKLWENKLNRIIIESKNTEQKRTFYTGLYHSFISPNLFSDVDGKYVIEGKVYSSGYPHYSTFSTWDTYRALHPLFTIIEQEKTKDFVNSLVSRHFDSKVGLPIWELVGHDNACMIGYNTVSPLADAVLKDIKGIDPEKTYQAIRAAAFNTQKHSPNYDKSGMKEYIKLSFVPGEINCSVSKTTEQNYYDWCISKVAEKLGYIEDAEMFQNRSLGYRHLFNPETKFLYAKYATGEWRDMNVNVWDDLKGNYISGNMWGYSSYVPHDVSGLINLIGGRKEFGDWLDEIFSDTSATEGEMHVDISGFIGKYGHGDEPSHHLPYMYNYAGQPWKTQELVRQVMDQFYTDQPDGLINNEDLGQMSAWYIFSAMGFYPVCPGDLNYIIGSPIFNRVTINLENGKTFTINTSRTSKRNKYIQSATLNGKQLTRSFITHEQIMNGGELSFEMGSRPNKNWGSAEDDLPVSKTGMTKNYLPELPLTYKPYDNDKQIVFEHTRDVHLQSRTPNANIYYTLDGSQPNQGSLLYEHPLRISKNTMLKAIAYSDNSEPSLIYEREYFKGKHFEDIDGFPKLSLEHPAGGYGNKEGKQLMDRIIASKHYADGFWTGWNGSDMVAMIDFGVERTFDNLSIGFLTHTGVWIFPPKSIEVYVSGDNVNYNTLTKMDFYIGKEHNTDPHITRKEMDLKNVKGRYLKIRVNNLGAIPDWHGATGHKPWLFIDEILIN